MGFCIKQCSIEVPFCKTGLEMQSRNKAFRVASSEYKASSGQRAHLNSQLCTLHSSYPFTRLSYLCHICCTDSETRVQQGCEPTEFKVASNLFRGAAAAHTHGHPKRFRSVDQIGGTCARDVGPEVVS